MRLAIVLMAVYAATSLPTARKTKITTTTTTRAPSDSSESEEEEWECGTDAFSKYLSENQIELDCPHLKKTFNQCCIKHDKCYDDQLGRKFCDDTFCNCLDTVTKGSKVCNTEDSPLFCGMVRQFGAEAYARSGNSTGVMLSVDEPQEPNPTDADSAEKSDDKDYDYESAIRHNDTVLKGPHRKGADLLDTVLKSHQ